MRETAAGETHKTRLHVGQQLGKVGAQSVGAPHERVAREKRHHIHINLGIKTRCDFKARISHIGIRHQNGLVFAPALTFQCHRSR